MQETKTIVQTKELDMTAEEFEAMMKEMGAEIIHPIEFKIDPIAKKDGKMLAFWTD